MPGMQTILIIDDSALFRRQARAVLEADGFAVVGEAVDGTSGLATVRELRPDLVLLDLGLPDIDGFEVATALTEGDWSGRVILTSSRDAREYGRRLHDTPCAGFIPKDELSGTAIQALLGEA
jgi:DNA-binding NarL/FixJ family response regulator